MASPTVSVVIPTRNRLDLLFRLLHSVRAQQFTDLEVIVIDDGSSIETIDAIRSRWAELDARFIYVPPAGPGQPGTGCAAPRNRGIRQGKGRFFAFCDDDDYWHGTDYLSVAVESLERFGGDYFVANMRGERDGVPLDKPWFPHWASILEKQAVWPEHHAYEISRAQFARAITHHYPHPNACVFRDTLMQQIEGYYDRCYLGEDVNIALRAGDRARKMLYRSDPPVTFDCTPRPRAFTNFSRLDRYVLVSAACQHARALAESKEIRHATRVIEAWHLLEMSKELLKMGRTAQAGTYWYEALTLHPSGSALRFSGEYLRALMKGRSVPMTEPHSR
jgi:glycosyltransferase involved in cell wall biosynthesis